LTVPEQYKGPEGDGGNGSSHNGGDATNGSGNGHKTFGGAGFGTLMMQMASGLHIVKATHRED
jgi:hypothetical protein